jgi:hypothetical protein
MTSKYCSRHFLRAAMDIMLRIVDHRTIGAKVSEKSIPIACSFPFTTMRALSFSTWHDGLVLALKIHMALMGIFPLGLDDTGV